MKRRLNYSYLLHWICDDQRIKIRKNYQCESFIPYLQQGEWIL